MSSMGPRSSPRSTWNLDIIRFGWSRMMYPRQDSGRTKVTTSSWLCRSDWRRHQWLSNHSWIRCFKNSYRSLSWCSSTISSSTVGLIPTIWVILRSSWAFFKITSCTPIRGSVRSGSHISIPYHSFWYRCYLTQWPWKPCCCVRKVILNSSFSMFGDM